MKPAPVVIKKYGNRRLYDTAEQPVRESRRYCRDSFAKARRLQVVDAKTGQDLTRVTLTQIITEDAKDKPTGLPLELLRQLIVASDEVRQEFVMWYLKSAFDTYQKVQDAVQSRLGRSPVRHSVPGGHDEEVSGRGGTPHAASPERTGTRCAAQASGRIRGPPRKTRRGKPTAA